MGASGDSTGEATYLNKDTSNVVWVRDLKPKAKTTIAFKYSLEWCVDAPQTMLIPLHSWALSLDTDALLTRPDPCVEWNDRPAGTEITVKA